MPNHPWLPSHLGNNKYSNLARIQMFAICPPIIVRILNLSVISILFLYCTRKMISISVIFAKISWSKMWSYISKKWKRINVGHWKIEKKRKVYLKHNFTAKIVIFEQLIQIIDLNKVILTLAISACHFIDNQDRVFRRETSSSIRRTD